MNRDKLAFRIGLMQTLNNTLTLSNRYNMHTIKQIIKHFTKRERFTNKIIPLWITAYSVGYFNVALNDLK